MVKMVLAACWWWWQFFSALGVMCSLQHCWFNYAVLRTMYSALHWEVKCAVLYIGESSVQCLGLSDMCSAVYLGEKWQCCSVLSA